MLDTRTVVKELTLLKSLSSAARAAAVFARGVVNWCIVLWMESSGFSKRSTKWRRVVRAFDFC
jgi:hypothetical protein